MKGYSRRSFIQGGLLGASTLIAFPLSKAYGNSKDDVNFEEIDVVIELSAVKRNVLIENGHNPEFWTYVGKLLKGKPSNLKNIPGSYLGPTIEVNQGDRVRITFKNNIDEKSIIHWHGLDVSHKNDGHPHNAVEAGQSYEYDFVVENRAGMYWYHPHPHGRTGAQVYQGLAGLFHVKDQEEAKLLLPKGNQELSFVFQDRSFKDNGELNYRPSMMGAFGDTLMINGKKNADVVKVKRGKYRLRLLNGCNARIFNMSLSNGENFLQIGSDGGLLKDAEKVKRFYFAPAERFDCVIDFSNYNIGDSINIESLPLVEGRGEKFDLLKFEIEEGHPEAYKTPTSLSKYDVIKETEAVNVSNPKRFELIPKRGVGWTINGRGYESNNYEKDELINFGSTEIWEFYNPTGMPHPMHIHGTQFQVLNRQSGQLVGCLDSGWKDTVLIMPGDRVQVIKRFNTFKGTFIYHCHNLEHEDMSMMRNFKII